MKVDKESRDDIVNIGDIKTINSRIREEDLGLAFKFVSENLYSRPIDSFIRELVTNAVDANIGADEESPVMVHIYPEDGTMYVEIKDNGNGMSSEFFEEVYMSWFASDKRDNNQKHGGWGIGSKSPLAYQQEYEVITRYNGTEYTYVIAKEIDENTGLPIPQATPIMNEPTDKPNGTTIRVEIKDGDSREIHKACKNQLAYFKSVYVKDEFYFYDNDFVIVENDDYYLRNKNYPYGEDMHISLGQVAYPINWYALGLDAIKIPVALRFDIGELDVPLSREEINYTKTTIKILKERIEKVHKILIKKYSEQLKINDLFDYIITNNNMRNNKEYPPLVLSGISIPMTNVKEDFFFTPYEGVKIASKNINDLFSSYLITQIKGGRKYPLGVDSFKNYYHLYRNPHYCYISEGSALNKYNVQYIYNGYVFYKKYVGVQTFRKLALALDEVASDDKGAYIINYSRGGNRPLYKDGASVRVYKFLKYLENYLKEKIQKFENQATEEWIEEYKARERAKREETKGEINFYDIYRKRHKLEIKYLNDIKAIFIVRKDKNTEYILHWNRLYNLGNDNFLKSTKFLILAPTVYDKLIKRRNIHDITSLVKVASYKRLLAKIHLSALYKKYISPCTNILDKSSYYISLAAKVNIFTENVPKRSSVSTIDNYGEERTFNINILDYFSKEFEDIYNEMLEGKIKPFYCLTEFLELKNFVDKHTLFAYAPEETPIFALYNYIVKNKVLKFNKIITEMYHLKSLKNDKKFKLLV